MTFDSFIAKWSASSGAERANKDLFFTELCDVLGVPRPNPVTGDASRDTYVFEKDVPFLHADGRQTTRKIDVYRHGCFLLEAKQGSDATSAKLGTARRETDAWNLAMQNALGQALGYARSIEDPPPFLVVADIGYCFDLYACFDRSSVWSPYPNAQQRRILLKDLPAHADTLRAVLADPLSLDPSRRAAKVTREVAEHLAELAAILERAGHAQEVVARFLMRCLFTMFAEDVGLLPERLFTQSIEKAWLPNPAAFPVGIEQLWRTMNDGGELFLVGKILRFNGGLFRDAASVPLDREGLARLYEAAKCDWSAVEPAIFGTLLERALDAKERHRLGAHYTPRAYVERLVRPTVEDPVREEWDLVRAEVHRLVGKSLDEHGRASKKNRDKATKLIHEFHRRLCGLRVLDPACGSGNFLYVTLDLFMHIESEVLALLSELGHRQELLGMHTVRVSPGQFLGIEVKPWAKEIAELVLWIGYLQWHFRAYAQTRPVPDPVLSDYGNIQCRDAVLAYDDEELVRDPVNGKPVTRWDGETRKAHPVTGLPVPDESARAPLCRYVNPRRADWPKADFIVGNPPFVGNKRMRSSLGDGYVDALRAAHSDVPDSVDFVMYWWHMAAQRVAAGEVRRAGLITTNSITQTFNRAVVAEALSSKTPVSIAFAIPNHPWVDSVDGADVRIAMTVTAPGSVEGRLVQVVDESRVVDEVVEPIVEEHTGAIHADLRVGANIAGADALLSNKGLCFQGVKLVQPRKADGFTIRSQDVAAFGGCDGLVIKPFLSNRDLMQHRSDRFVIDFFGLDEHGARAAHPRAFQRVADQVKPYRDVNPRASRRKNWWLFGELCPAMRRALKGIERYIVTSEVAKHRVFQFEPSSTIPDASLYVIASDDAALLGLLSSRPHVTWAVATARRMGVGNDPGYISSRGFEPFPFPVLDSDGVERMRVLGEALDAHRKRALANHPKLTLTDVYNVLARVRAGDSLAPKERSIYDDALIGVLRDLHDSIDLATFDAYGWPTDLDDEALLERLADLNRSRRQDERRGVVHWLRPDLQRGASTPTALDIDVPSGGADSDSEDDDGDGAPTKAPWPKSLPEQLSAVRAEIRTITSAFTREDVGRRFVGASGAEMDEVLGCLAALGLVLRLDSHGDAAATFAPVEGVAAAARSPSSFPPSI